MTVTISGVDGVLHLLALLCFLVAAILAWVRPDHRGVHMLVAAGLALWVLTTLIH
jgi:hypothetical protein